MAARTKQPEQQAPPAQRVRIRYAKRGTARFTSHRDFARAFERALNRAGVPIAYSSGFSPHPRISYANASATGAASEAEYLEIALSAECDPARLAEALNATLPPGMAVLAAVDSDRTPFTELLTVSAWLIEPPEDTDLGALATAVETLMAESAHPVSRMTKSGLREFDVRGALAGLVLADGRLRLVLRHQTPLVRPDDVLTALTELDPGLGTVDCRTTRLAQGREGDGATVLLEPFTGLRTSVQWDAVS